jgi:hypothetical protein
MRPCISQFKYSQEVIGFRPNDFAIAQTLRSSTRLPLQNIDQSAASCERQITSSLEGCAMQTRITISKWFEAKEGFGAIQRGTTTAILSIFTIVAFITLAITAFANIQMGSVG